MKYAYYKAEWLPILRAQENDLRSEGFTAEDCLKIGTIMHRLAREKYKRACSFRIVTKGQTTFSFLMDGTDMNNEWWMDKKLNTCRLTGMSSMRTLVETAESAYPMEPEFEIENNYALCGGCFPVRNIAGKVTAYVLCSGMPHECDHQLIADALSEYLGVKIDRVAEA